MKSIVLGHRGASAYAPENTLAAFQLAFEMGADGIELDVAITKDGVPVVIHDDSVDRTTDGHGLICDMTLAEVKRLDAGVKFEKYRGEKIPTLAEVLEAVGTRGIVNVELKSSGRQTLGLEAAVAQVIADTGTQDHILISSFDRLALHRIAYENDLLPRALLYAHHLPHTFRHHERLLTDDLTALHPRFTSITRTFMRWARSWNYQINTWTVDDPDEAKRLAALGVEAIITNKPDVIKKALDE